MSEIPWLFQYFAWFSLVFPVCSKFPDFSLNGQTYINIAQHTHMRKSNLLISANKESHRRSTSEKIQTLSFRNYSVANGRKQLLTSINNLLNTDAICYLILSALHKQLSSAFPLCLNGWSKSYLVRETLVTAEVLTI